MASPFLLPLKPLAWEKKLPKARATKPGSPEEARCFRDGVRILAQARPKKLHKLTLSEQPFDSLLLSLSPLFVRNRETFLKTGGHFHSSLLSSPRSLSSPSLLDPTIQYSPVESELIWAASDPIESANLKLNRLYEARSYTTSLFHEQSHRILWKRLPPPPPVEKRSGSVFRYLNFVESLVITLDMALGDELGPNLAKIFYLTGATYDPGTDLRLKKISRRVYRNYLHACLYTTYLTLQLYDAEELPGIVTQLYPAEPLLTKRAIERATQLDEAFVRITNIDWQEKNEQTVVKRLSALNPKASPLILPRDPLDNRIAYILAEKWFENMGL
jgi:hypothetical protein